MTIYNHYFELNLNASKLWKKIKANPSKVADIYRRSISIGINSLHQIAKKKSAGGYAVAILETEHHFDSEATQNIQSKIRVYTKKKTALEHIRSIVLTTEYFINYFAISDVIMVPEDCEHYCAYMRVRMPTVKKQSTSVEIKKEILEQSPDCNFIYLMPSSSMNGSKRLIRYYYKVVPMAPMKAAQYSKPDGYGFSRTNRICPVAKIVI